MLKMVLYFIVSAIFFLLAASRNNDLAFGIL